MSFKTTGEIHRALGRGERLTLNNGSIGFYVHMVDDMLVDQTGEPTFYNFGDPKEWVIYKEPVKEWKPELQPFCAGLEYVCRRDKSILERDIKAWKSAIKLESFVREHAPDFVPVWGDDCKYLFQTTLGRWQYVSSKYNEPGRVPFPKNDKLATLACEMLNDGRLKL